MTRRLFPPTGAEVGVALVLAVLNRKKRPPRPPREPSEREIWNAEIARKKAEKKARKAATKEAAP